MSDRLNTCDGFGSRWQRSRCWRRRVCGAGDLRPRLSRPQMLQRHRGDPVALQHLHTDAAQLLPSNAAAFHALLHRLRGRPVVINEWASWRDNCSAEVAAFQTASVTFGGRVAFIGVDVADDTKSAKRFLRVFLSAYPSYSDPHQAIARSLEASGLYPQTLF